MWFKNLRIYRLDTAFALSAQQLAEMLAKMISDLVEILGGERK